MSILQDWLGGPQAEPAHPVAQRLFSRWLQNQTFPADGACVCGCAPLSGRRTAFAMLPDRQTIILLELADEGAPAMPSWELVNPAGTFCFTRHGGVRLELPEPGGEQLALRSRWLNIDDNAALFGIYGGESWVMERSAGVTGMSRDGFVWSGHDGKADCGTLLITACPLSLADALGREPVALRAELHGEPAEQVEFVRAMFCAGRDGRNYLFAANLAPVPTGAQRTHSERLRLRSLHSDTKQAFSPQLPGGRWKKCWPAQTEECATGDFEPVFPGECGLWVEE